MTMRIYKNEDCLKSTGIIGRKQMSTDEILNIKEVSNYLRIPVSTLYKLVQEGKIPATKLGKHWRFMKKDIDLLFAQKTPVKNQ